MWSSEHLGYSMFHNIALCGCVQVVESCLAISVVDYKGVTVKLLKLTGGVRGEGGGTCRIAHSSGSARHTC